MGAGIPLQPAGDEIANARCVEPTRFVVMRKRALLPMPCARHANGEQPARLVQKRRGDVRGRSAF